MKIALVKLSAIGDVVHALPLARALREARPEAEITWVAERREAALLRDHPDVDRVVAVDTRGWRRALRAPGQVPAAGRALGAAVRALRAVRADVALDAQGLLKSGLVTAATGAPLRVGFRAADCRERLNAWFTNRRVAAPRSRHVVEQYLALLAPLGVAAPRVEFQLAARPAAERAMAAWLATARVGPGDSLVVVSPGAGRADKRWAPDRFRALADALTSRGGARVLALWGPGEEALAAAAVAGLAPRALLAPPTDLDELVALLRRAALVVAGDTGPLHLAVAAGTSALGLYGPTRAARNGPYGPLGRAVESPTGAMADLAVDAALSAALEMLGCPASR